MNEAIGTVMKSGFPLLFLTFLLLILVGVWRRNDLPSARKWRWSVILVGPALLTFIALILMGRSPEMLLTGVITGQQPFSPPWPAVVYQVVVLSLFILPFSGILFWLLRGR